MTVEIVAIQTDVLGNVYLIRNSKDQYWVCAPPEYRCNLQEMLLRADSDSMIAKHDFVPVAEPMGAIIENSILRLEKNSTNFKGFYR